MWLGVTAKVVPGGGDSQMVVSILQQQRRGLCFLEECTQPPTPRQRDHKQKTQY